MKNFFRLVSLIVLLLGFQNQVKATHLYGGEMTYEYLGQLGTAPNLFRYRVTLKHYVTDVGNSITPTINFNYYNLNAASGNTLIRSQMQSSILSPILPLPMQPGCPITFPAMRIRTFVQTIDLPLAMNGYFVTAAANARNTDIDNIVGGNLSLYMQIPAPVLTNPGSSPVFTDTAVVVITAGDTVSIPNSSFDADGDKLVYSFNEPSDFNRGTSTFTTPPSMVQYRSGFSFSQPFGAGGFAAINTSTGLTRYFVPILPGSFTDRKFVVSIMVKEYRNFNGTDVLIGSTMRDIQLIVKTLPGAANQQPVISFSGPKTITITEGQAITPINFTFTDANAGQLLTITASSPLLDGPGNKNATFNALVSSPAKLTNVPSGTTATFSFTSACGDNNAFPLDITVTDNACPPSQRVESFLITVVKGTRLYNPTDITIPVTALNENVAANTTIGTLYTVDADACETHTLTLVPGTGSTDNAAFTLTSGGLLKINSSPNFEAKASYAIRVKTIDETGSPFEKTFTITINDVNEAPSTPIDANPATNTVSEITTNGSPTGITASATDQEGTAVTYSLTNSAGGRFAVDASTGVVSVANAALLDFETAATHQITVQASDGTLTTTQNFSIAVSDIDEIAPTLLITSSAGSSTTLNPIPVTVTFNETVTGFMASDIVVTGGTVTNFSGTGMVYTFEIIPASNGVVTVNIPAGIATDAAGNGNVAASPFSITYGPTGIQHNDLAAKLNLQVYPNPSSGTFSIGLHTVSKTELTIVDLAGKKVFAKTLESIDGNVKETLHLKMAPGIYFLQVNAENQLLSKKLILQP